MDRVDPKHVVIDNERGAAQPMTAEEARAAQGAVSGGFEGMSLTLRADDPESIGPWGSLGMLASLSWFFLFLLGVVIFLAWGFSMLPYRVENFKYEGYSIFTNNPPRAPLRGHGAPQVRFALESHMDIIAEIME